MLNEQPKKMTFITRLAFLAHLVTAAPFVYSPEIAGLKLMDRPKLIYYAMEVHSTKQQEMLYLYERLAASMQCFLGICGLFMGVDNWYMPLALMLYDAANAYILSGFLDEKPNEIGEVVEKIMLAFGVGAFIGFVGLVRRLTTKGFSLTKGAGGEPFIVRIQALLVVTTYFIEIVMAFPFYWNLFDISSPNFQKVLWKDSKLLLDVHSERIAVGAVAMCIISIGSFFANNMNIHAPHAVAHMMLGGSFLMSVAWYRNNGGGWTFEFPTFMHFLVAIGNALNYTRSYRKAATKIIMDIFAKREKAEEVKEKKDQ